MIKYSVKIIRRDAIIRMIQGQNKLDGLHLTRTFQNY